MTGPLGAVAVLTLACMMVNGSAHIAAADAGSGSVLWEADYAGPGGAGFGGQDVATSPDGSTVYVTGGGAEGYSTLAFDASTGQRMWQRRYAGPAEGPGNARALSITPDGTTVLVTGGSAAANERTDYATLAYDASTGAQLWVRRYDGPGARRHGNDAANAIAVSPDGATAYVTGSSAGSLSNLDHATIAYDTATGRRIWTQRYDGPEGQVDLASAIAVSPDGDAVFVTGSTDGFLQYGYRYVTAAYDASTGTELWRTRFDSHDDAEPGDIARSIGVSPDGTKVFVTGDTSNDFVTLAYDAADGSELWSDRYGGESSTGINVLTVSQDGSRVFASGGIRMPIDPVTVFPQQAYLVTIAYDASTGARAWVNRWSGPADIGASGYAVAVSPDGTQVFAAGVAYTPKPGLTYGNNYNVATLAYDAETGNRRWVRVLGRGSGISISVSPDGTRAFVTGASTIALAS
jgi:outer membrane protein assembly factor BamB